MTAVLFDLDRTLIDAQTHTDYVSAAADVRAQIGDWSDVAVPDTEWDAPTVECMATLVALSGDDRWDAVSDSIERYELATAARSTTMPGLADALAATAHLSRAVVTLLPERAARAILNLHGVEIATLIPRRSDYRPKPAPDQIVHALDTLGVAAGDAVFIGDSSWDAQAAGAAGVRFVGVTNDGVSTLPAEVEAYPDLLAAVGAALDSARG